MNVYWLFIKCTGRHSAVYWVKVPTSKNPIAQVSRSASTLRRKNGIGPEAIVYLSDRKFTRLT